MADAEETLVEEVDIAGEAASEQDSIALEDGGTSFDLVLVLAGYQRGGLCHRPQRGDRVVVNLYGMGIIRQW